MNDLVSRRDFFTGAASAGALSISCRSSWAQRETPAVLGTDPLHLATISGGSGPPALFVHGFGSSKYTWRKVCAGLEDVFSYHAIDMPGAGDTPAPTDFDFSVESLSNALAGYIEARDFRNLTIIASSLGAAVTFVAILRNTASLAPRLRSLCIVDGACYPQKLPPFVDVLRWPIIRDLSDRAQPPQQIAEILARWALGYCFFDSSRITEEQVKEYASYARRDDTRRAIGRVARSINPSTLARYVPLLKTIAIPSLLIWGSDDRVIPVENGRRLQGDLPNAEFFAIERCGHLPQEERPDEVGSLMRRYYKSS